MQGVNLGGDPGKIVGLVESEAKKGRTPTQLSWVELCHPNIHVYLEPQNVMLFGNKVLADVVSYWG